MKNTFLVLIACIGILPATLNAQSKKSGITNFIVNGHEQQMGMGAPNEPDLNFIGDASTRLKDSTLVSDEMVKYTQNKLREFLGYDLTPVDLNRPSSTPDQLNGRLFVMSTITDKKAFKQLGYDEVIEIDCRIASSGSSGNNYKAYMEIFLKITDKDGKTTFKKREKLKRDEKIPATLLRVPKEASGFSFDFKNKGGSNEPQGINALVLLDWYKQTLDNLLIK